MKSFKAKMTESGLHFYDLEGFGKFKKEHLDQKFTVTFERDDLISNQQMKSIHVYFGRIADKLNDSGQDMRVFIRQGITIPWTKESVKEYIWRPVQKSMYGKKSTKKLSRDEVSQVYKVVDRELGQRAGIHEEFPAYETENNL